VHADFDATPYFGATATNAPLIPHQTLFSPHARTRLWVAASHRSFTFDSFQLVAEGLPCLFIRMIHDEPHSLWNSKGRDLRLIAATYSPRADATRLTNLREKSSMAI
jgi:hypothetical protein